MLVLKALTLDASDCYLVLPCSDQALSGHMVSIGLAKIPFRGSSGFSFCFSSSVRTSVASSALWAPCLLLRPIPSTHSSIFSERKHTVTSSLSCSPALLPLTQVSATTFLLLLPGNVFNKWSHSAVLAYGGLDMEGTGQGHQATALVH